MERDRTYMAWLLGGSPVWRALPGSRAMLGVPLAWDPEWASWWREQRKRREELLLQGNAQLGRPRRKR